MKSSVVVTGATGDVGLTVCRKFLDKGWNVIAVVRSQHSGERTASKLSSENFSYVQSNEELPSKIRSLICCAGGISESARFEEITDESVNLLMESNLYFNARVIRLCLPKLKRNESSTIVAIGSRSVIEPSVNRSWYTISKVALLALLRSVATESPTVCTVMIAPDTLDTLSNRSWSSVEDRENWKSPESLAEKIFELCEVSDPRISGTIIPFF